MHPALCGQDFMAVFHGHTQTPMCLLYHVTGRPSLRIGLQKSVRAPWGAPSPPPPRSGRSPRGASCSRSCCQRWSARSRAARPSSDRRLGAPAPAPAPPSSPAACVSSCAGETYSPLYPEVNPNTWHWWSTRAACPSSDRRLDALAPAPPSSPATCISVCASVT